MKFLRIAAAAALTAIIAFTAFAGKNKIADNGVLISPAEYKGILTLWHIDTFEGGIGSRKQFLLSVGRDFEKRNCGVLVTALDYTAESAEKAMAEGRFPDLISFGTGVDVKNLQPIDVETVSGGVYNGETYAYSWCRGGYCLIENPEYKGLKGESALIVSQGEYTNPLIAFSLSGKTAEKIETLSPFNAYIKFVSGKSRCLLGTQRDINRLITRGMDFITKPLCGYNDLYQYISVVSQDPVKAVYAQEFVKYLSTETVQKKLSAIGMYSCFFDVGYDSPDMDVMQKTDTENRLSAFSSKELIEELQARSVLCAQGNDEELLKIKKLIAIP